MKASQRGSGCFNILLVEDNEDDVTLTREAISETKLAINMSTARDGEEAMAYLRKQCGYRKALNPDLILLDWNLPRKSGREVLCEIKEHETLRRIPVVILTTSDAEEDVQGAYSLHANSYIRKPIHLDQFLRVMRSIQEYWFNLVRLPRKEDGGYGYCHYPAG